MQKSDTVARRHLVAAILATGLAIMAPGGAAQTLTLDTGIGPASGGPPRGSSMAEVEQRFGAPPERSGPVGEPPITTWRYPQFTVYFEHDRVIDSVVHR